MSQPTISCHLCKNVCNSHNSLYDANGSRTEVYLITAKYFGTKLLDYNRNKHLSVICTDCWVHISDFNAFEESVLLAQQLFVNKQKDLAIVSKSRHNSVTPIHASDNNFIISEVVDGLTSTSNDKQVHNNAVMYEQELMSENYSNDEKAKSSLILHKEEDNNKDESDDENEMMDTYKKSEVLGNETYKTNFNSTCLIRSNAVISSIISDQDMVTSSNDHTRLSVKEEQDVSQDRLCSANPIHQSDNNVFISDVDQSHHVADLYTNCKATNSSIIHRQDTSTISIKEEQETLSISNERAGLFIKEEDNSEEECEKVKVALGNYKSSEATVNSYFGEECPKLQTKNLQLPSYGAISSTVSHQGNSSIIIKEEELMLTSSIAKESENVLQSEESANETAISGDEFSDIQNKKVQLRSLQDYESFISKWRPTLECEICGATTSNYSSLLQHFQEHHPKESCHIMCCDHKFHNRHEIVQHIIYHKKEKNGFKCERCFKVYGRKDTLNEHIEVVHFGKGDRIKCPKCDTILRKSYLKKHLKRNCSNGVEDKNAGDRPYLCNICGKSFATELYLKTHNKRVHSSSSTSNICTICNRAFVIKSHFNRHMAKHNGKPFDCPYCPNKTYSYSYTLVDHLKKLHPKEWEEQHRKNTLKDTSCSFCPRTFKYPSQLKIHTEKMHLKNADNIKMKT